LFTAGDARADAEGDKEGEREEIGGVGLEDWRFVLGDKGSKVAEDAIEVFEVEAERGKAPIFKAFGTIVRCFGAFVFSYRSSYQYHVSVKVVEEQSHRPLLSPVYLPTSLQHS
jgi:hypothetical protein